LDGGEEQPRGGAFDLLLEVFDETPITVQRRKGSFHRPSAWQQIEALCGIGSLDDLKRPGSDFEVIATDVF